MIGNLNENVFASVDLVNASLELRILIFAVKFFFLAFFENLFEFPKVIKSQTQINLQR